MLPTAAAKLGCAGPIPSHPMDVRLPGPDIIVASSRDPPIRSPRDVTSRTAPALLPGCRYRSRLKGWFIRDGVPIERMVAVASYHAILGCAARGVWAWRRCRSAFWKALPRARSSVFILFGAWGSVRTLLAWRKQAPRAKIRCLAAFLLADVEKPRQSARIFLLPGDRV